MAERVAPSDEYLRHLRNDLAEFMAVSQFHWPILFTSFVVALVALSLVARRKAVCLSSPMFLLPTLGFLLFLWVFTELRSVLAEWVIELAGWSGDLHGWAKPPYLLGSKWYAGILFALGWFATHPLILLTKMPQSTGRRVLAFVPSMLLAAAVFLWLYGGFFAGFLLYI